MHIYHGGTYQPEIFGKGFPKTPSTRELLGWFIRSAGLLWQNKRAYLRYSTYALYTHTQEERGKPCTHTAPCRLSLPMTTFLYPVL